MEKLKIYATGDGYPVYLILEETVKAYDLPLCVELKGELSHEVDIALIPHPKVEEKELLSSLGGNVRVISADCGSLPNCEEVKGDYVIGALKGIFEKYAPPLVEKLRSYKPPEWNSEMLSRLGKKLRFYIPLGVSDSKAVLELWRYYLGQKGFPFSGYLFPFEERGALNILTNVGFSDKVFPLILGKVSEDFLHEVERRGFVPFAVESEVEDYLERILDYLILVREVVKGLKGL